MWRVLTNPTAEDSRKASLTLQQPLDHASRGRILASKIMALSRRDVILAGIAIFIAWGYGIDWVPTLRYLPHAFVAGVLVTVLGGLALLLLTSRGSRSKFHTSLLIDI